jgi:hypothetical protein
LLTISHSCVKNYNSIFIAHCILRDQFLNFLIALILQAKREFAKYFEDLID